jgi:hypothetical protein
MTSLKQRIKALEGEGSGPTHEQALAAMGRLESPPPGYTDKMRAFDTALLDRDALELQRMD